MSSDVAVLETVPTTSPNLFGASSPEAVLIIAQEMAAPLAKVIRDNDMITVIKGNEHVQIEGWQTLGSMLGISAHTVWSRPIEGDDPVRNAGWEARAEARTRYGEVVGSAEAMCMRNERGGQWRQADEYAVRSMSQTRAQSKALASALRFVMTLAGTSGSPAEEVPDAAVPAWARPVPDLHELVRACADVLGGTLNMELATEHAKTLCQRIYNDCGGDVPMVVWQTFSLLLGAMLDRDAVGEAEGGDEQPTATVVGDAVGEATEAEVAGGNAELDADDAARDTYGTAPTDPRDPETTTEEDQS